MMLNKLTLEIRQGAIADYQPLMGSGVLITPAINEDYWILRVKLSDKQAIVGFPKFTTLGIGFAVETDWNTNLPYDCTTNEIWQHIKRNKGDRRIADKDCIRAIKMIQNEWTRLNHNSRK